MNMTLMFLVLTAFGQPDPNTVATRVRDAYQQARDVTANFEQTYVDKLRGPHPTESGQLWAKKDGRVRWSYRSPVQKDFVYDGSTAYFYEPESAQVTVFEKFEYSPLASALRFLWGQGDLRAYFDVRACEKRCDEGPKDSLVVALWPKEDLPTVDHIVLYVHPKRYTVSTSVVFDALGNRNQYAFKDLNPKASVDVKKFKFKIPEGVSVLRSALDAAKN